MSTGNMKARVSIELRAGDVLVATSDSPGLFSAVFAEMLKELPQDDPRTHQHNVAVPREAEVANARLIAEAINALPALLDIAEAVANAPESTVQPNRGYMKDCNHYAPAHKELDGQRVLLVAAPSVCRHFWSAPNTASMVMCAWCGITADSTAVLPLAGEVAK